MYQVGYTMFSKWRSHSRYFFTFVDILKGAAHRLLSIGFLSSSLQCIEHLLLSRIQRKKVFITRGHFSCECNEVTYWSQNGMSIYEVKWNEVRQLALQDLILPAHCDMDKDVFNAVTYRKDDCTDWSIPGIRAAKGYVDSATEDNTAAPICRAKDNSWRDFEGCRISTPFPTGSMEYAQRGYRRTEWESQRSRFGSWNRLFTASYHPLTASLCPTRDVARGIGTTTYNLGQSWVPDSNSFRIDDASATCISMK